MQGVNDPQEQPERESHAEQEATEFLAQLLRSNPLPEPKKADPEWEGIYKLSDEDARELNCLAIVKNGEIVPLIDFEESPPPKTPGERMCYYATVIKTISEGLIEALLFWEERRRQEQQDRNNDEEGTCHV